jgi:hypothetical protein
MCAIVQIRIGGPVDPSLGEVLGALARRGAARPRSFARRSAQLRIASHASTAVRCRGRVGGAEVPRVFRTPIFALFLRGCLHFQVLVHDLLRGPVPECRVKTHMIIAKLDVARNIRPGVFTCRVHGTMHPLDFQCAVERFGERIVKGQIPVRPTDCLIPSLPSTPANSADV